MKLRAYGYGEDLHNVDAASPKATVGGDARRFEYQHQKVTEWFVNAKDGLEQGFTVHQRPSATPDASPLRVALSFAGDLKAREITGEKNGGIAFSDQSGATVLTYRKLRAWDANKCDLPAQMKLETGANGRRAGGQTRSARAG